MILVIVLALASLFLPVSILATDIFEDFTDPTGFSSKISGDYRLVSYSLTDNQLIIHSQPRDFYNSITVSKNYRYDLSRTTWFHFKFKMAEYLLGQDMYTTITFYQDNDKSKPLQLTLGINSEQHWKSNYFIGSQLPICEAKPTDDEFFLSVSPGLFPYAEDNRLYYPTGYTKKYTDWTVFSIKYEPAATPSGLATFSFYVDGRQVDNYHSLDNPHGSPINPTTSALNNLNLTDITLSFTTLVDGNEYSYTGNKYGSRGRGCYTPVTPAIPSTLNFPAKFEGNNGLTFKTAWMKDFDNVAQIIVDQIRTQNISIPTYQFPKSSLTPLPIDATPATRPTELYKYLPLHFYNNPPLQITTAQAIWNGIYAGTINLHTAIYLGAIELPPPDHTIWQYCSATTYSEITSTLQNLKTTWPNLPLAKAYVWYQVFSLGNLPDVVHFGYLTPEDITDPNILKYLSALDRSTIPLPAQPKTSIFYWDYYIIDRLPPIPTIIPTNTPKPTATPTRIPTPTPTKIPSPTPTKTPTATPIATPTIIESLCTQCPSLPQAKSQGDADCSGNTTINDVSIWRSEFVLEQYGTIIETNWFSDFDCDGKVTINDASIWRDNFIKGL